MIEATDEIEITDEMQLLILDWRDKENDGEGDLVATIKSLFELYEQSKPNSEAVAWIDSADLKDFLDGMTFTHMFSLSREPHHKRQKHKLLLYVKPSTQEQQYNNNIALEL